jgi:hypothetical protein
MRRLICLTLLITFCLTLTASAVTASRWNRNVVNPAGAVTVAKSGAAPDAQYLIPSLSYEEARTVMDPMTDFGIYVTGCIVPPTDGDYTFVTSSDDSSAFALSADSDIANAVQIASLTGWNGAEAFTTIASGTRVTSAPIALKAGQSYAFWFAHQNGAAGGTNGSVGWMGPDPIGSTFKVLDGVYIQPLPGTGGITAKIAPAMLGNPATLKCVLPLSSLSPEITGVATWYKKGDAGDTQVGTGLTATIAAVTDADAGVYYCKLADLVSNDATLVVQHGLIHRYTFNEADVDTIIIKDVLNQDGDNAGAFDGLLYDLSGKDKFSATALTFGNTTQSSGAANASYVDLPNGMISSVGPQMTIEAWWTQITTGIWQRIFDFGTSDCGEDSSCGGGSQAYLYLCSREGGNSTIWYGYKTSTRLDNSETNIGGNNDTGHRAPLNVEKMYAVTVDEIAGVTKLYYDGIPMGHLKTRMSLKTELIDNNNWIGRSQWGDTAAGGTINEFRIWDVALSPGEIARHVLVGPDDPSMAPAPTCTTVDTQMALDINKDCVVDLQDYAILVGKWLDSTPL